MLVDVDSFVGRTKELDELQRRWVAVTAGGPEVVLVTGLAGIGKSSLVDVFRRNASPRSTRIFTGDEFERDLAYAALDRLTHGTSGNRRPTRWDSPQAAGAVLLDALETSCGPALIVVDDLHLVDPESLQAILFALRRLHHPTLAEPVNLNEARFGAYY